MRLKDVLSQIDVVSGEYHVCLIAAVRLRADMVRDPTLVRRLEVTRGGVAGRIRRLEHTYSVRIFAVFEWALREIWEHSFRRVTEPPMRDLIDAAAAARSMIPSKFIDNAHQVRNFRNSIVHLNTTERTEITLLECVKQLKAYLSYMPREW